MFIDFKETKEDQINMQGLSLSGSDRRQDYKDHLLKGTCMVKILTKTRRNPRIDDHFGFMKIRTLKITYMKPCANQSILGNSILDIQSTLKVC